MEPFIQPPTRIPFYMRLGIWISKKMTGKDLLPAKILAWYPKAAIGSGCLELLVAHHDRKLDERIMKLVRIQASFTVACPFCIDMNSFDYIENHITEDELKFLQGRKSIDDVHTFSERELLAIEYTKLISHTPPEFSPSFIEKMKQSFDEREMVILASTAAQVNYWGRLISALGIPPAGFSTNCEL